MGGPPLKRRIPLLPSSSKAADPVQPCSCRIGCRRRLAGEPELRPVQPHPEQHDGHASGQRGRGALLATPRRDFSQFIFLLACSIDVAAWKSAVRSAASPVLVISPDTSRSPDWLRFGVSPAQAPMSLALRNRDGPSTAVTKANAVTGPTPGIVISRRHVASDRARLLTFFVIMASSLRICLRRRRIGPTASDSIALSAVSSRTRSSQRPVETWPSFRPKLRRMPRTESSSRVRPSTSALREVSRARFSWDATDPARAPAGTSPCAGGGRFPRRPAGPS